MSDDPIRDLENFSPGGPSMAPLPAHEVRRRGDRMRRRRTAALSVAGAVAVAAVIAAPLALADGNGDAGRDPGFTTSSPSVTTSASAGAAWLASVPKGFPLDAGVPAKNPDDGSAVVTEPGTNGTIDQVCDQPVDLAAGRVDERAAAYLDSSDMRSRALMLYGDDDAARNAYDEVAAVIEGCGPQPWGDGTESVTTPFEMETGDAAIGWTVRKRTDGRFYPDVTVWQVVRVGNALLVSILSQEIGSGPGAAEKAREAAVAEVAPLVEAMDLFAEHPAAVTAPPDPDQLPRATTSDGIPADFPVDRDLVSPEGDPVDGPSATAAGVPGTELCGSPVWPSGGSARLAATATGPELRDSRELVLYDTADEAVEVVTGLRDAVSACPDQEVEGGSTQVITSLPGDTGYDTVTFAVTYTEGLGGGVYQFTRVGRAVLATYDGGEWGPDSIASGAATATKLTGRITPAMCTFTDAGC